MTTQAAMSGVEPARDVSAPATFERLEFGKFCQSVDGPIETNRDNIPIGYSQLGMSAGFPEALIPLCEPNTIGIAVGESDLVPQEQCHGTVLRSVILGEPKTVWRLFYRIRSRSEEGEGRLGRRYTMARYLMANDNVPPSVVLNAMDAVPFRGLTRTDVIEPVTTLASQRYNAPKAFLSEAVTYVFSGIAVGITENILEAEFFGYVNALWWVLPPALRPHLSAGWNVGNSYSGRLTITHTASRAGDVALFSTATQSWTPPDFARGWNGQGSMINHRLAEEDLVPGRSFARYVFDEEGSVSMDRPPSDERLSTLIGSLPPSKLPRFPDWRDRLTVRAFLYPGQKARDHFLLRSVEQWLSTGEGEGDFVDIRELMYQNSRIKALEFIMRALGNPGTRGRGDRAFWASMSRNNSISLINNICGSNGLGSERAKLLLGITRRDVKVALQGMLQASQLNEIDELPSEAVAELEQLLLASVNRPWDTNTLHLHVALLNSPPLLYQQWLARHATRLIRALTAKPEAFGEELLLRVRDLNRSAEVLAFLELVKGREPSATLKSMLNDLPEDTREIFVDYFMQEWIRSDEDTANRREQLIQWVPPLRPPPEAHPLLRLMANKPLSEEDINRLADEVERGDVPPSLTIRTAACMLRNWPTIGRRTSTAISVWQRITRLWPAMIARALVGREGASDPGTEIEHAAREFKIAPPELLNLIRERALTSTFDQVAPQFWQWAVQFAPTPNRQLPATALDLVWCVANQHPLPDTVANTLEVSIFSRLARAAGKIPFRNNHHEEWSATPDGWRLMLLLSLFPEADFVPLASQLSWFVRYRNWLNEHLQGKEIHPARRERFDLAMRPFHSLSFRDNGELWHDKFARHVIWAAFKRVPVHLLQPLALREAIRAYTGTSTSQPTGAQSYELMEQQADLCLTFINSYEGSRSQDLAVERALHEFALRLLSYNRAIDSVVDVFDWVGRDFPGYAGRVERITPLPPRLYDLLYKIVLLWPRRQTIWAIKTFYKGRAL